MRKKIEVEASTIHEILKDVKQEFNNGRTLGERYESLCQAVLFSELDVNERRIFFRYYDSEVQNRKVFYHYNGEKVDENDFSIGDIREYYLFKPYDIERRNKWLDTKIAKTSKEGDKIYKLY